MNTKYGTAPVLVLVPVVDVVVVDVLVVSEALVLMEVPFVTGAVAFRTVKNTLECFTRLGPAAALLPSMLGAMHDILAVTLLEPSLNN